MNIEKMNPTGRFSSRVENYVRYRPNYPQKVVKLLCNETGLNENSIIADIGSGTGILTGLLLAENCKVYGVEPNAAMRRAGEDFLKDFSKFESVDGTAENTNLPAASVTHITSAQAFHWFDREGAKREFKRILRPNGFVALIWNERKLDADDFSVDYEKLLQDFGTDLSQVAQNYASDTDLPEFFDYDFQEVSLDNFQILDFAGLKGRLLSSSYVPTEESKSFPAMMAALERLFARHSNAGTVEISYETKVFYKRF